MSNIAVAAVQTNIVQSKLPAQAAQAATAATAKKTEAETPQAAPAPVVPIRNDPAPQAAVVAPAAMSVPIAAQAVTAVASAAAHVDPQADHGNDDQHGHLVIPPPVVQPPVVKPPVISPPPVLRPPVHRPAIGDPGAPERTIAMVDAQLASGATAQQARIAFVGAAAERRAAATVAQGHAALAILQSTFNDTQAFQSRWLGRNPYAPDPAAA